MAAEAVKARERTSRFVDGALPNVIIIGAQKCGTSALHRYLARHPDIWMSRKKELDFFIAERNWEKGVDWYRTHFDPSARLRGESSPDYTADPRFAGVPARMAGLVPDAKLIFLVRDPIDRIRSQWIHNFSNRAQRAGIERAVLEDPEYVARSSYHHQLRLFLEQFPLERILVMDQEELLRSRRPALRRTFEYLGVRMVWRQTYREKRLVTKRRRRKTVLGSLGARYLPPRMWRPLRNRRPFSVPFVHPELSPQIRAELAERLRDDAAAFRELTGQSFSHWSV